MTLKPSARVRPVVVTLALLAALLVSALALAPRAEAFIYWNGYGTIERANLDGSGVEPSFITDSRRDAGGRWPSATRHIYWADGYTGTIERANLDGTGVDHSFITGADAGSVAVDAAHVYWSTQAGPPKTRMAPPSFAPISTARTRRALTSRRATPAGLGGRRRAHLLGRQLFRLRDRPRQPRRHRGRAGLHLCRAAPPGILGIGRRRRAHLLDHFTATGTIGRANLDGSGVEPSFITGASFPGGYRGRRRARLLDRLGLRHDRARQPRRLRRRPQLHHRSWASRGSSP